MADETTPGAPRGTPADLAPTVEIVTALARLTEQLHAGGPPRPAPYHESRQVPRRQSGPARDRKGRFRKRQ